MSSIVVAGDTSGSVTLQAPAVSGSTVLTLPAVSGTVMVNGPAFSAYATANQTIPSNIYTKIQLPFELFDTNNNFDSTTNYRFTPTVAGYYQINAGVATTTTGTFLVSIGKNSAEVIRGNQILGDVAARLGIVSSIIQMNGSTDYIELLFFQTALASQNTTGGAGTVYMNGFLARSA